MVGIDPGAGSGNAAGQGLGFGTGDSLDLEGAMPGDLKNQPSSMM